jgi:hypothetical protein
MGPQGPLEGVTRLFRENLLLMLDCELESSMGPEGPTTCSPEKFPKNRWPFAIFD